jgi:hypothetical protein
MAAASSIHSVSAAAGSGGGSGGGLASGMAVAITDDNRFDYRYVTQTVCI